MFPLKGKEAVGRVRVNENGLKGDGDGMITHFLLLHKKMRMWLKWCSWSDVNGWRGDDEYMNNVDESWTFAVFRRQFPFLLHLEKRA